MEQATVLIGEIDKRKIEDKIDDLCPELSFLKIEKLVDFLVGVIMERERQLFFAVKNALHGEHNEKLERDARIKAFKEVKEMLSDTFGHDCGGEIEKVRRYLNEKINFQE